MKTKKIVTINPDKKIKCPVCLGKNSDCSICNGKGKIPAPHNLKKLIPEKVVIANKLRSAGFSFSEIMKLMNYKSKRSVSFLLNKKRK